VLKATIASVLALAAVSLTACGNGKDEGAAPAAPTTTATAPAAMPSTLPDNHPAAKPATEVDVAGVEKAPGGKTIAEIFAEKDALANQQVTLRGKVVKVNAGVMNMDWLHLRDGSGGEGSNDLTVTTAPQSAAKVGDTVLVTGTVATSKDYGMGYQYPVILEKADVKVEAPSAP
jgi:predicted extracellular nuclease